ncbi:MAG: hypothetical protein WBG92_17700, partial [Thiohalocapsa sp.]
GLVGLLALIALSMLWGEAEAVSPMGLERAETVPIATPVKAFRDCQEIARCTGCKPVYRCRSCTYQRACTRGFCEWRDVCVWGPYVKVLPRDGRIIRIR